MLDSGIDLNHPEFAGRLWTNPREIPGNGIDDDANGCVDDVYGCRFVNLTQERAAACGYSSSAATGAVMDDHGQPGAASHSHGTLVSGIVGARGDNEQGITGVAWSLRLMTVKVLDCGVPSRSGQASGDLSNVAQGIDYARRMGARVINVSLSTRDGTSDIAILRDAILAAQSEGVIIVAAAGNHTAGSGSVRPGYPAAYSEDPAFTGVVAVGASDNVNGNEWASYSNYGPAIDLAAPGNQIASTTRTDFAPAAGYGIASEGTSFAAPLVSGLFALLIARNSGLGAGDYIMAARLSATPPLPAPHGQNWAGAEVIDLGRAVQRVPMSVVGAALHDWKDVPAGSAVVAMVGLTPCGEARTSSAVIAAFAMIVKSGADVPGYGVPGSEVRIVINGADAKPSLTWGGRNVDLHVAGIEFSSVTPAPGASVSQRLGQGWSNLAHLGAAGPPAAAFAYLPAGWTEVWRWEARAGPGGEGAFLRHTRDSPGYANDLQAVTTFEALWVFTQAGAVVLSPNPDPVPGRSIALQQGWNNFVYTGTTGRVTDALAGIGGKYDSVARLDNESGDWGLYLPGSPRYLNDFGGLLRLGVYWVHMTEPATLVMK